MFSLQNNAKYSDAALFRRYEFAGSVCAQLAIALGLVVLLGWANGLNLLSSILREWVAMQPNTALCLMLAGTSLLAAAKKRTNRSWQTIQIAAASVVFGVAFATLVQYATGLSPGIDQLLHPGSPDIDHLIPGRLAVATATTFRREHAVVHGASDVSSRPHKSVF